MDCDKSNLSPIHLEWDTGEQLWPNKATFSYSAEEYDYLWCEFGSDVAKELREFLTITEDNSSGVRPYQPVKVYLGGKLTRTMYFKPDFIETGNQEYNSSQDMYGRLELHDLHEQLQKGSVNYRPDQKPLKIVYGEIFNRRKSSLPEYETLDRIQFEFDKNPKSLQNPNDVPLPAGRPIALRRYENQGVPDHLDNKFHVEFEDATPFEAIKEVNEKVGLTSAITPDGALHIGQFPMNPPANVFTASTIGNKTDFHISEASLNKPFDAVKQVIIEGPPPDKATLKAFNKNTDKHISSEDARLEAVCTKEASKYGKTLRFKNHNMQTDELEAIAKRKLLFELQKQNDSKATINGRSSNTTPDFNIGDIIQIPKRKDPCTNESYPGGNYLVKGVEHRWDKKWEVICSLQKIVDNTESINTSLRIFEYNKDQSYSYDKVYGYEPPDRRPR